MLKMEIKNWLGILISIFSISFSHTRALMAKSAAGTKYSHLLLPIVNPTDLVKQLFATN